MIGDYKRLLLEILKANRPEAQPVNLEQAKDEAKQLYARGEGKIGTGAASSSNELTSRR